MRRKGVVKALKKSIKGRRKKKRSFFCILPKGKIEKIASRSVGLDLRTKEALPVCIHCHKSHSEMTSSEAQGEWGVWETKEGWALNNGRKWAWGPPEILHI